MSLFRGGVRDDANRHVRSGESDDVTDVVRDSEVTLTLSWITWFVQSRNKMSRLVSGSPATLRESRIRHQIIDNSLDQARTAVAEDQSVIAPVSMARATLEQRLADFPVKLTEFRDYVDAAIATIRQAGDIDAAGVEVEDAHRDAMAKVTEVERRASAAERAARLAEDRATVAERER